MGVGDTARVRHCLYDGLWELEGSDGQTYLAVLARGWRPAEHAHFTSATDLPPIPHASQMKPWPWRSSLTSKRT